MTNLTIAQLQTLHKHHKRKAKIHQRMEKMSAFVENKTHHKKQAAIHHSMAALFAKKLKRMNKTGATHEH